jgi:hypothetical protein
MAKAKPMSTIMTTALTEGEGMGDGAGDGAGDGDGGELRHGICHTAFAAAKLRASLVGGELGLQLLAPRPPQYSLATAHAAYLKT